MQIAVDMSGGATIVISIVYPELGRMDLDLNGEEMTLRCVALDVMLDLVKGLDVHTHVSLLSQDHSTHGKSHTKQDIIDFIENLMAERGAGETPQPEMPEVTEDDDDTSTV